MNRTLDSKWLYLIVGAFILLNSLLVSFEFFYFPILPVALGIVLLSLLALDKLVILIVFCTPLSVNITNIGGGVGLAIPTDPLLFGAMLIFFIKLIMNGSFDKKLLSHPISIAILINIAWITITAFSSSLPIVSLKFLLSRLWFVITYYFLASQIFVKKESLFSYWWFYIIPFMGIIGYTIYRHYTFGFDQQSANWVMSPFYNDHTVYGAILAMFFPLLLFFTFSNKYSATTRGFIFIVLVIYTIALLLSYTRAAWVSLIVALGVYIAMKLRIKFSTLFVTGSIFLILLALSWTQIEMKLEKNRQDSADDFSKHVKSISNISSDASNLERLNRWNSAFRMFELKPFMGWGPGTYAFKYAPFQMSKDKTIISTNAGDLGNAHSEYIGPLAECGVFGSLSFILILITSLYSGITLYFKLSDENIKGLVMAITLGLITYYIHGFLNNFLDTDKASCPFWGFMAMLVMIESYHLPYELPEEIEI